MARLNFHHLHCFWAVAREGHPTRAAARLHLSPSALSTRSGRTPQLTEAGRLALSCAEDVFTSGNELAALLRDGVRQHRQVLRIGAVATLSRNFQENFVKPLLSRSDIELVLQSGSLQDLLQRLRVHPLDLVLSNRCVHADADHPWRSRSIARQPVSLVGKPRPKRRPICIPEDRAEVPSLLPGRDSDARAGFDLLCGQHGLRCHGWLRLTTWHFCACWPAAAARWR